MERKLQFGIVGVLQLAILSAAVPRGHGFAALLLGAASVGLMLVLLFWEVTAHPPFE